MERKEAEKEYKPNEIEVAEFFDSKMWEAVQDLLTHRWNRHYGNLKNPEASDTVMRVAQGALVELDFAITQTENAFKQAAKIDDEKKEDDEQEPNTV